MNRNVEARPAAAGWHWPWRVAHGERFGDICAAERHERLAVGVNPRLERDLTTSKPRSGGIAEVATWITPIYVAAARLVGG